MVHEYGKNFNGYILNNLLRVLDYVLDLVLVERCAHVTRWFWRLLHRAMFPPLPDSKEEGTSKGFQILLEPTCKR
jgi:hypothetical protein